jgi:diguanylate cyclase (GGDEF)-like protein
VVLKSRIRTRISIDGRGNPEAGRRGLTFVAGICLACAIGFVDVKTGYEINLGLFYLAPIALVTWNAGTIGGLALSLASVLGMFVVDNFVTRDTPFPSGDLIPYWNTLIRIGYFVTFTAILSALKRAHDRERSFARQDYLTGIANNYAFAEAARREIASAHYFQHPISFAYLDCDNFKAINDAKGHKVGDELLRQAARNMTEHVREFDLVARLGGDEFGILLPGAGVALAGSVVQRIRRALLAEMAQGDWRVTFSIGVVTFRTPPADPDEAIRITDSLMYAVKRNGKDSVLHRVFDRRIGLVDASGA